jgi:hypothetical protein
MTPDLAVPPDAWQLGPHNRWSFQHVDQMVAVQTVAHDRDRVRAWPVHQQALDDLIEPLLADAWVDGVLVARDGAIVAERYANGMTAETLHLSQSVAKSVVGLLVGILIDRGRLRREDLAGAHVPEVAAGGYGDATVGHLLDMTASVGFVEDYADFWRYDTACGWHPSSPGVPDTILEFLPTVGPADRPHGTRFDYLSPDTDLLGLVAQRAGGAPLAELVAEHVWGPMGAERDAQLTVDRGGTAVASGGLCACLRDYARIGQLVADGGGGIVPAAWIDSLGQGSDAAWAASADADERPGTSGYANQWWCLDGRPTARGIHGQMVTVHRPLGIVIAVLSSQPEALDPGLGAVQRTFAAAVIERLAGERQAAES